MKYLETVFLRSWTPYILPYRFNPSHCLITAEQAVTHKVHKLNFTSRSGNIIARRNMPSLWNEPVKWNIYLSPEGKMLAVQCSPTDTLYEHAQLLWHFPMECLTSIASHCKDKRPSNKQLVGFQLSLKEQQRHAEKHFQRAAPSFQYRPTAIHSGRKMTQTKLLSAAAAKAWTFKAKRKHASLSGDYSTSDVAAAHRCRLA